MRRLLIILALLSVVAAIGASLAFARSRSVTVRDNAFSARTLKIKKGDKVTWRWSGTANRHNVTAVKGGRFHSKTMKKGGYSHTFRKRGTYTIVCTIHLTVMRLKVKVL